MLLASRYIITHNLTISITSDHDSASPYL